MNIDSLFTRLCICDFYNKNHGTDSYQSNAPSTNHGGKEQTGGRGQKPLVRKILCTLKLKGQSTLRYEIP